ncbi:MAG: PAS domain S-box protein [Verrucomicrobia bacterium]|nr:PAS domain S-box protein [Verrucomicrobiota bacterium]
MKVPVPTNDPIGPGSGSDALFHGVALPILVLGKDLRLRLFTRQAAQMLQLKALDDGGRISSLRGKVPNLGKLAAQVMQSGHGLETEIQCQSKWYLLRIQPLQIPSGVPDGAVILFVDIDQSKRAQAEFSNLNSTLLALFQSAPDAIVTVDARGRIDRVNNQTEAMFGYTSPELRGQRIEILMPARFKAGHLRHRASYVREPQLRLMGAGLELFGRRKDGTEFPVDIMLSPIETPEGPSVIATIRDITARKRAEEELRKSREEQVLLAERTAALAALETRSRQQKAISDLSQHALEGLDLTSLLKDAVLLVQQMLGLEFCKVLELSPDRQRLLLRAGVGWKLDNLANVALGAGAESQAGFTLLSKSPVIVDNLRTEKRFRGSSLLLEHGAVSGVSVIIHGRARPHGVLEAHTMRQRKFTPDDIHFLQSIASILAAAIERRGLEEELLDISGREQSRMGQDLHDGLCQQLAGIEFRNSVLAQQLVDDPSAAAEARAIGELLRGVTREARNLARGLSPIHLEANGLMSALETLSGNTAKLFNISCQFACGRPVLLTNNTVATHLYRIAQEAISNAIQHGHAKSVSVSLNESGGEVSLTIFDSGCGFTRENEIIDGMGLRIMEYRAELIGATLGIDSIPGKGTTVVCKLKSNR